MTVRGKTRDIDPMAAAVREAVREHGLSGAKLGEAIGLPKTTVAHVLDGTHPLRVGHLIDIAQAIGSSPADIIEELDSVPPEPDEVSQAVRDLPLTTIRDLCAVAGLSPTELNLWT